MSCDLTLGRKEVCKDSVGGLNAVYFVNFGDMGALTYDSTNTDVIDAVAGTPDAFKYELKGASTFTQNINSSREAGTTFFEQVLELTFKKLTPKDHKELKLLSFARPHVIVEDYNGNFFLAGLEHGCDVTGGTIVTGGAMADLSGYTLTLTGMERVPANFLDTNPAAVGFTVVVGS
jgi:hypothetical protein